jgi:hypothetical protein
MTRSKSSWGTRRWGAPGSGCGVVDEAVDLSPELERAGCITAHLFSIADVGDEGLKDAGAGDRRGQARQPRFVTVDCEDIGALQDQAVGDSRAKVACGAGDDDVFSGEEHGIFQF